MDNYMSDCYGMAIFMKTVLLSAGFVWSTGSMEYCPDCTEYSGVHPVVGIGATTP